MSNGIDMRWRIGAEGRKEAPVGGATHGIVGCSGGDPECDGVAVWKEILSLVEVCESCEEVMCGQGKGAWRCVVG